MPFNFLNQGQTDDAATRFQPIDTFIDPVSKIRVSNPANLIDTDFEYGLQPTKWETVEIINNTPAFFSKSGDTTISDITGITTNGGTREITVTTAFPHLLDVGIPIRVSGTKSVTADGSYIINATPTATTFTYLARANQPETISIFDLYSSIITGEFFQGSQISISDAEGMTTDGVGPNSTITIKTENKHGFGPKTPFYFLNLNSTVSQEFESTNSTSLSFDPSNSATAQSFDGSNTLLQTPVDLSNSATTSIYQNNITSTDSINATVTISIVAEDSENWASLQYGDPLYYDVNIGSGYFQSNPRGVVFIKNVSGIDTTNNVATFQVSDVPDGNPLSILANMTGYFQIADQAKTFAGNNIDEQSQIEIILEKGEEFSFDGGNQGYDGVPEDYENNTPPANEATVVGYTGTTISIFTAEGNLDYYVGSMLEYSTDGDAAAGLSNNSTYFVTSFSPGQSSGLYNMTIAEFPNGNNINVSGGTGNQTFSKIGISIDKDIVHVKNSNFLEKDMLEYTFPTNGNFGADFEQQFYFVEIAYDAHNYKLSENPSFNPIVATGGNSVSTIYDQGKIWKLHRFTSVGSSTFTVQEIGDSSTVEYLIVAGGGGGSDTGSGGAGGMIEGTYDVTATSYGVVVGNGGAGRADNSSSFGGQGQDSTLFGLTALGGGGAGSGFNVGSRTAPSGGSGGGGSSNNPNNLQGFGGTGLQPGSASGGFGHDGGDGTPGGDWEAGGGGGAGGPGGNASNDFAGNGGIGKVSYITGERMFYAGGGGGATGNYEGALGGLGGGADGQRHTVSTADPPDAISNTGGGGGGIWGGGNAGNGASGVVMIRYPLTDVISSSDSFLEATGGDAVSFTENGIQYNAHIFKNTGTDTFTVTKEASNPEMNRVEYLIIGGGGGGAALFGGGGAGGFREGISSVTLNSYPVVVGAGGAATANTTNQTMGNDGQDSSFNNIVAAGGGGGSGSRGVRGRSGGSGGGGSAWSATFTLGGVGNSPSTFLRQGTDGGASHATSSSEAGGGGGGAGYRGDAGRANGRGGNGGDGRVSPILPASVATAQNVGEVVGNEVYYAGGGGGAIWTGRTVTSQGIGGLGGGGDAAGGTISVGSGNPGLPNTGGGGGGASRYNELVAGGAGGSGVVIIRYEVGIV